MAYPCHSPANSVQCSFVLRSRHRHAALSVTIHIFQPECTISPWLVQEDDRSVSRLDVRCRRGIDGASLDHDLTQLPGVDGLVQPQGMRTAIECREMFFDQADRTIVRPLHDAIDFLVDDAGGSLAVFTRTGRQGSACEWVLAVAKGDGAQALAHTPAGDHLASNTGDALQVVFRSGCDVPDCHFLGGPAAESRDQLRFQVLSGIIVTVIEGRILRHTKGLTTRDYGYF